MAGLWLENGLHLQIQNSLAKELAEEIQKNGSADFLGTKIQAVKPDSSTVSPRELDNSKRLVRRWDSRSSSTNPKKKT